MVNYSPSYLTERREKVEKRVKVLKVVVCVELLIIIVLQFLYRSPNLFLINLESESYRGAKLYWEKGNPLPEERVAIFKMVVDSISDDVKEEYSLSQNPLKVYYLLGKNYQNACSGSVACYNLIKRRVFISDSLVNGFLDDGAFAMFLLHEYIHVVQHNNKTYLAQYSKDIGWVDESVPREPKAEFYMVLSDYSLTKPVEDMAETLMFSYLCDNSLEGLSEVRMEYILDFWDKPLDEICKDFD